MVELELLIQRMSSGYAVEAILTLFVSKSIFDLVNLRKLRPKMSGCASDNTPITGVGQVLWSKAMSTRAVPNVIKTLPVAPTR